MPERFRNICCTAGIRVDVANNGQEALDMLAQSKFDLVLMDIQMPVMDGLQATRKIIQDHPYRERPVIIAMTADALLGDREKCLAAGMNDYISKPIQFGVVEKMITSWGEKILEEGNRN